MYESNADSLVTALSGADPNVFTSDTLAKIVALASSGGTTIHVEQTEVQAGGAVTVPAGTSVAFISDTIHTTITPPSDVPVVVFHGNSGVHAIFNDGGAVSSSGNVRLVVGSAVGDDSIVIADARDSHVVLGAGNSTVVGGIGQDTIVAGTGNSTISGGGGFDIVEIHGSASDYKVTVDHGHAIVHDNVTGQTMDVSQVQYVEVDGGGALVFARSAQEAAITTLYETTFGRTAEAGGLQYWFDAAAHGASLADISKAFTNSAEFLQSTAQLSDTEFIAGLYQNTFGRAADDGGAAYWAQALHNGATRAQLIEAFAGIAGDNLAGHGNGEVHIVGHVTVIPNII